MLTGTVALITGGSRGIGAACARKLAALGADIAVIYAGTQNLLRSIPVERVMEWEEKYLVEMRARHQDALDILHTGVMTEKEQEAMKQAAAVVSQDMTA